VLVFPDAFEKYGGLVQQDSALLICAEVSRQDDRLRVSAQEIYPLSEAARLFAQEFHVHVPVVHVDSGYLERLVTVLRGHPGTVPVTICVVYPSNEKVFVKAGKPYAVLPDTELVAEIEHLLGEGSVYIKVRSEACLAPPQRRRWQRHNGNSTSS
jgi:DNA polymerase III alpha subunit